MAKRRGYVLDYYSTMEINGFKFVHCEFLLTTFTRGGSVLEVLGLMGFSFGMISFIFATTVQTRVAFLEKRIKKLEAQLGVKSPSDH